MEEKKSEKYIIAFFILIFLLGLFIRFYLINLRPMSLDESTHWFFFLDRVYHGEYLYYFPDYHGFTSWYIAMIPLYFLELSLFSLRLMPVLFGSLTIFLFFFLRKEIGMPGAIFSSLFLAISPSFVYYSEILSQYPFLNFFMLLTFIFLVYFFKTFNKNYLYLFAVSCGLFFTIHENFIIFLFAIVSFAFLYYSFNFSGEKSISNLIKKKNLNYKTIAIALLLFGITIIIIMSCFFSNWESLFGFLTKFMFHFNKAVSINNRPFFYYFSTFYNIELFTFLFSFLSLFFIRKNNYFELFVFYWAATSFFIFSMISYKLPWIFTAVLIPMYVLSGIAVTNIYRKIKHSSVYKLLFILFFIALFSVTLYKTVDLTYFNHSSDPDKNPLNLAGTTYDQYRLVKDLDFYFSNRTNVSVLIASAHAWPIPYYIRDNNITLVNSSADRDSVLNLSEYYDDFEIIFINNITHYNPLSLDKLATYEIRPGVYLDMLKSKVYHANKSEHLNI